MSNVNLILSRAVGAARGDRAACAAGITEGTTRAFAQYAQHGQRTPFINGRNAAEGWKGELGTAILAVILVYYDEARLLHESRAKLSTADLAAVEGRIAADVAAAYAAEAARQEARKAEGKARREAAKAEKAAQAEKAALEEAADTLRLQAEVSSVRTLLDRAIEERDALQEKLDAARIQITALKAELVKATPSRKVKAAPAMAVAA